MAPDYAKIKAAAEGYKADMVRFLREMIYHPSESCEEREVAACIRAEMEKLGFDLLPGEHPIVPVMLYDPRTASEFARRMLEKGVYVVGFCYPVVPKGKDRIRTQISAGHTKEDIDFAVKAFGEVKKEMGL